MTFSAPRVRRIVLSDFRSYPTLDLTVGARLVVLTGENGAGKTNVLEALSLLNAGRGLRRAELADMACRDGRGGFAVSAEFSADGMTVQLGAGYDPRGETGGRQFRIDRVPVPSARAFADHVRIVWLTPSMDGLFAGPAGERRRFLDRLALGVDPAHGARVNALERALRNRNRLLEDGASDALWLDAAEREVAEIGVAVAAARVETVSRLAGAIDDTRRDDDPFPFAALALSGAIEERIADAPAIDVEDFFKRALRDNRGRDAAAGRALIGPQASDLLVRHGPKNVEAAQASTGEQKALLTGLVLAHARLVASMSAIAPLALLDEVAAHFDPRRRAALFDRLEALGGQVWMTGADEAAFADLRGRAAFLRVTPGRVAGVAS